MGNGNTADLDAFGEFGVPSHVIQKNRREQVWIGINEFQGREYINIRLFFDTGEGYRPTRRGVTVPTGMYPGVTEGGSGVGGDLGGYRPRDLAGGHTGIARRISNRAEPLR